MYNQYTEYVTGDSIYMYSTVHGTTIRVLLPGKPSNFKPDHSWLNADLADDYI